MKANKVVLALVLTAVAVLMVPSFAFANMAIHGNYVSDTDACAGCHRAHTSVSSITWSDSAGGNQHSTLLVTAATEMWQFCYACHDAASQGADTNVQTGVYEGTEFGNNGATLNGGGFEEVDGQPVTSRHMYEGSGWGAYGGGYFGTGKAFATDYSDAGQGPDAFMPGTGNEIKMDCATCHDPHGSPNYRILKTVVNGNPVGEYVPTAVPDDPDPDGFVSSVEVGWPVNGFRLHTPYPGYQPDYTTARYAKGYNMLDVNVATPGSDLNPTKGMSGWCAGCHSTYLGPVEEFTKTVAGIDTTYASVASTYNAGDGSGLALRHKHPINVELSTYNGPDKASMIITSQVLPLAHAIDERGTQTNEASDWIECLTCHRAHGTSASMSGFASHAGAATIVDPLPGPNQGMPTNLFISQDPVPSSLLRYDNRGVCERCHNK